MKRNRLLILISVLALFLLALCAGCADIGSGELTPTPAPAPGSASPEVTPMPAPIEFPENTVIFGVDLAGLDAEEGRAALKAAVGKYTLSIAVGGTVEKFSATDLGIAVANTDLSRAIETLTQDPAAVDRIEKELILCNDDAISNVVNALPGLESTAKDACLIYNADTGRFELQKDEDGLGVDLDALRENIKAAIYSLQGRLEVELTESPVKARITADSEIAKQALEDANAIFDLDLCYSYAPATGKAAVEKLSPQQLAGLFYVKNGLELAVDTDALNQYVSRMSSAHNVAGPAVRFETTGGGYLNLNSKITGEFVDTEKLYNDLYDCLTDRVSGTRSVAYYTVTEKDVSGNYGGNYVEINLTAQHLWVYKNGQCVVSTDIVSGNVAAGNATPTGVYKIFSKQTDRYLTGPTWHSYVNFWMPFNGGVGLHDSSWRSAYGGNIYLTNGSHGCVNMPYSAAAATYENVSIGTYVIVYGGASVKDPQTITGTMEYTVTNGDAPFVLDAAPKYDADLFYVSDNENVATVDSDGTVTIVGPGTAKITVSTEVDVGANIAVTITVMPNQCDLGNHEWDAGVVIAPATCTEDGVRIYTCAHCGETWTERIPATGHEFLDGWCIHCGTPDPSVAAPPPEETPGPDPETPPPPETSEPPKEPEE